jgi:hypothetical protein
MLDDLDKELEKRRHKFVRYADDCVRHEARYQHGRKKYLPPVVGR